MAIELLSEHTCFGGVQQFGPAQATQGQVPVLFYLAGLTWTEETFAIKAGAQRVAAELGIMLVSSDTSPRGANIPGETDSWDFGVAAGFYLDASQAPWSSHYRMESYVTGELLQLVLGKFAADQDRVGIFGHSMGGHGALTLALRHPDIYRSVSAFAPIAAPSQCPWGQKAFSHYLGSDETVWQQHDASALMRGLQCPFPRGILIDQGLSDKFLAEQLLPEQFESACVAAAQPLRLRRHAGYDHGYYFISSFMEDHLRFHAEVLG